MQEATAMLSREQSSQRRVHPASQAAQYLVLLVLGIIFVMPLIWMISTSVKTNEQLGLWPPAWLPNPVDLQNYPDAWNAAPFAVYLRNTLIITTLTLIGQVFSTSAVAYGFARMRFPGRDTLFILVLATMMLPSVVTLVPSYILFQKLGWLNTFAPLVVPAYFGGGAFFIFLLRQFFRSIPMELSEAAKIDGASHLRILFQMILPLSKPALATVIIFSFTASWNDFLGPLIYLTSQRNYTLTIGLQVFLQQYTAQYQALMAISFLMTLPVIIVFFFAQQYFVQGIVMSGLKG